MDHRKALFNLLSLQLTSCPSAPVTADQGDRQTVLQKRMLLSRGGSFLLKQSVMAGSLSWKMVTNPVDVLLVLQAFPGKPFTAAGLASSKTPYAGRWSLVVTLNMMMFCLASQPFPAEPLSCCMQVDPM